MDSRSEMGLIQAIEYFIDHRVDVVRRRTSFLLTKARDREHILEGYQVALDHLDDVIAIIRGSGNRGEARDNFVAYFGGKTIDVNVNGKKSSVDVGKKKPERGFDARQADAILELQLHRLTRLSIDEIISELKEILEHIAEYESILASEKKLRGVIIKELEEVKKNYGDERRTQILDEAAELSLEDLIADEQAAVTVRTPDISSDAVSTTGMHGVAGLDDRDENARRRLRRAAHHWVHARVSAGLHQCGPRLLAESLRSARRRTRRQRQAHRQPGLVATGRDGTRHSERPRPGRRRPFVFFATRNGTVKKTPLPDFSNVMSRGIIAIGIDKDDELVTARLTDGKQIVFLASHEGMAIRFSEEDVRSMGRQPYGVRGMDMDQRLHCRHGYHAQAGRARSEGRGGSCGRGQEGDPYPRSNRKWVRKANPGGRVSSAGTWWFGRD